MKKKKVVLLQGAFDILNYGHVKAFARCAKEGDYVIIALNTNKLLKHYKGKIGVLPYKHKKVIIESIRYVDKVVAAHNFSPLALLKKYDVDVYCLSREWESTKEIEIAYMKEKGGRCVFLPRYKGGIATSQIKQTLLAEAKNCESDSH